MSARTYLDYNATAPLHPRAREAMIEAMAAPGNASSVHQEGRVARRRIEAARTSVAALVGAEPSNVTFTSGGSEANSTVLTPDWQVNGKPVRFERLLVSAIEHPSVLAGGRFGAEAVELIPVDANGVIDLEALDRMLGEGKGRALVSVMAANNETGVLQPVSEAARIAHDHDALTHSDAVQLVGKLPFSLGELCADVITLSGHKLGAPSGVGAIVRTPGVGTFRPLVSGGGQESRLRAGTENVAAIIGFGAVADLGAPEEATIAEWRAMTAELERDLGNEVTVFGSDVERLPQTLAFAQPGISAETAVIALDLAGIAVSSGSACSSGRVGPSHVLAAMDVNPALAGSAIRVSFGWASDRKDLELFLTAWRDVLNHASRTK